MIAFIIQFCCRHRFLTIVLTTFLVAGGLWTLEHIHLDAIPDLSDVQVIVQTDYPGQAPEVVEAQVTYPLTSALLAVPHAKDVRGLSMFGTSFIYVLFEDGTDLYWARSRVLEYLNYAAGRLPKGVTPQLGPDATGVGWVYEYSVRNGYYCPKHPNGQYRDPKQPGLWYASREDAPVEARDRLERIRMFESAGRCPWGDDNELVLAEFDLAELRSLQDWYLRYELNSLEGVSEVATVGGFVRQYQVVVDPDRLLAYDISLDRIAAAIERSNREVGGGVLEMSEMEYMVRGRGYLADLTREQVQQAVADGIPLGRLRAQQGIEDLESVVIRASEGGTPVYLRDVADVRLGPEMRRGLAESSGRGEVVGGIVVMRFGENARRVIQSVKTKLDDLKTGLPPGVGIRTEYDRSGLIDRAVGTLRETLLQEMLVVGLVCIVLLLHARSELVAVFTIPTGLLASLIIMHLLGINANIMSLGGLAIAIGVMVDSSVVMVENAHKHLDREEERLHDLMARGLPAVHRPRNEVILEAAQEVGPTLFFSLLIITVSFVPVFALGETGGRLFKPLAFTKTFAVAAGSLLAITIVPVLMTFLITSRVLPRSWGRRINLLLTLAAMGLPAAVLLFLPLGALAEYRAWLVIGWAVLAGMLLIPQKIIHERSNPLSRWMQRLYHPFFAAAMQRPWLTLVAALLVTLSALFPFLGAAHVPLVGPPLVSRWPSLAEAFPGLGSEFMPPLDEGDLLYMPTTDPAISITKARELLQQTDAIIASFPEVRGVFGKIGRADTATDPAPTNMIETTITLELDRGKWRQRHVERWHSALPRWLRDTLALSYFFPEQRPISVDELCYGYDENGVHRAGLDEAVSFPGVTNAWTMPIRTRIDMLSTGIKTPVGIKVMGEDLEVLGELADRIAAAVRTLPGTLSAYPDRTVGGMYANFDIDRDEAARYDLTIGDVQDVLLTAVGGQNITWTVEGLERYPVNLRYKRELRDNLPALERVLVASPGGAQVPLAQLARVEIAPGPPMIKSENARKTAWIFVDLKTSDIGGWIRRAKQAVESGVTLPPGYNLIWSGQFEYMQKAAARLRVVIPITLLVIILLLYAATQSWFQTCVVLLAVPFSLVGAVWILYLLDYNLSLAVIIGMIALAGVDAETGQVMLLYLNNSFEHFKREGRLQSPTDLWLCVHDGAVMRIRPKFMTVATDFIGLLPLMWAVGTGADTMRRLAAPMIGGLITSFIMELLIYPVIFYVAKRRELGRATTADNRSESLLTEPPL